MKRRSRYLWPAGIAGIVAVLIIGYLYVFAPPSPTLRLRANDPVLVEQGRSLYATHCASCHGENLEGQANWRTRGSDGKLPAPPHDETGHTWHHRDELLIALTLEGPKVVAGVDYQTDMPAYAGVLSEAQVVAVLSYIKSRWPASVRDRHDRLHDHR